MGKFLNYAIERLKEGSSKAAIIFLAGLGGYAVAPESIDQIVLILGLISTFLAFFHKEKGSPDTVGALGYLKQRLSEKSTKLAIIGLAGLAGFAVSPEQINVIAGLVGSVGGLFALFSKEK